MPCAAQVAAALLPAARVAAGRRAAAALRPARRAARAAPGGCAPPRQSATRAYTPPMRSATRATLPLSYPSRALTPPTASHLPSPTRRDPPPPPANTAPAGHRGPSPLHLLQPSQPRRQVLGSQRQRRRRRPRRRRLGRGRPPPRPRPQPRAQPNAGGHAPPSRAAFCSLPPSPAAKAFFSLPRSIARICPFRGKFCVLIPPTLHQNGTCSYHSPTAPQISRRCRPTCRAARSARSLSRRRPTAGWWGGSQARTRPCPNDPTADPSSRPKTCLVHTAALGTFAPWLQCPIEPIE